MASNETQGVSKTQSGSICSRKDLNKLALLLANLEFTTGCKYFPKLWVSTEEASLHSWPAAMLLHHVLIIMRDYIIITIPCNIYMERKTDNPLLSGESVELSVAWVFQPRAGDGLSHILKIALFPCPILCLSIEKLA